MSTNRTTEASPQASPWRSLEQLAESWGLSRARTHLVVKALIRSGRMEERVLPDDDDHREFRMVSH